MKNKRALIVIISVFVYFGVGLVILAMYQRSSDMKIEAMEAYGELKLGELYDEGDYVETEGGFDVNEQGYLVNSGDSDTYKIKLGYLDFADKEADKVIIDAVAVENSSATLKMYVGDDKAPFLEMDIPEANSDELSSFEDMCIFDVTDANIKGKKLITMELVFNGEAEDEGLELRNIEFKTATIPTLYFDIDESYGTIEEMNADKDNYCTGGLAISIPEGYQAEYTHSILEDFKCQVENIHGRGNSTWDCDKKSYTMKLTTKEDLFGMGECKKWVLLANYYDKSLMRDKLAYNLACDMGIPYSAQSVFVDVVMNDRYVGSYLLSEKVEVKDNRVEIQDLDDFPEETDESIINGGYLLQLKPYERVDRNDGEMYFKASRIEKAVVFESPNFENGYNNTQFEYIKDYYHSFEEAVYSDDFCNSDGVRYTELIDIDSFVDFYIVNEVFKNNDALYASTFFYKDKDSKLCIGPIWDLDLSAGTYMCNGTENPEGFFINGQYIFHRLVKDPEFVQKVIDRYYEVHDHITKMYSDDNDEGISSIRKYAQMLDISQKMNFDKWGMGNRGWEAVLGQGSYEAEVEYLEEWLEKRVNWLDENIESLMP